MTPDEMERKGGPRAADFIFAVAIVIALIGVFGNRDRIESSHSLHHSDCVECYTKGGEE